MNSRFRFRRKTLVVIPTVGLLLLGSAAGCYERVVRAEGLGAQSVSVQKPYRSETSIDRAFDGNSSDSGSNSSISSPTAPRAPR